MRLALTSGRPRGLRSRRTLGSALSSLTRWVGQYRDEEIARTLRSKDDLQAELKRLRKENLVLEAGA